MSKNKNIIQVDFSNGDASEHVTGSCHLISTSKYNILLECGLAQSNDLKGDYLTNSKNFNFKTKEIDYIFLSHWHADHSCRIPLLYMRGCQADIIIPTGGTRILKDMFLDSAHIAMKDAETLSRQTGREVKPLYTEADAMNAIGHCKEFDFNKKIDLNDDISFNFIHAGHILMSAQIELWITESNKTKKILYTGDLGNTNIEKYYVDNFQRCEKANLVIAETTYGDRTRPSADKRTREKDLIKLKEIITNTCLHNRSRVLIPVFALDRAQEMLAILFDMFADDKDFKIPVLLDSPLMLKHVKSYFNILQGGKLEKFNKVMSWKNIVQIGDWPETKTWAENNQACIILSSSGMLTSGRVINYLPQVLANPFSHILFCGYMSENSLGWRIKNGKDTKIIKINDIMCRNRCPITSLTSFSSHMQHNGLLEYYSSINCDKIALVHGQMKNKISFGAELQDEYSKKNRTTKVTIVNSGTVINL